MNESELRIGILHALSEVAPEADGSSLRGDVPLRDQLDIDSLDYVNFLARLDATFHVAIPEADYPQITTLDALVTYLKERLPALS